MKIRNIIFVFLGIILVASFIIILSFCGDPIINKTKSEEVLIQKYDEYANNPKNRLTKIDLNQPNDKLFEIGLDLLNNKYDIINAEKVFRHLESKDPNNPKYQYYKGRSSFFIGEFNYFPNQRDSYDVAYAEFVKLTATYPSNTDYLLMKSYAAGRIGLFIRQKDGLLKAFSKLMESSNLINTILAREPDHTDALLTKGEIEYENPLGSKSEALKIYNYVSDKYPNNLRAKVLISKYYFKTAHEKNRENNQEEFKKYLKLAELELYKVQDLYAKGKAPKLPETQQMMAYLPRNLGEIYWSQGRQKEACEQFSIHNKIRNTSDSGYFWLGICYKQQGEKEKAIKYFKKSLFYNKWNIGAQNMLKELHKK